MIITKKLEEFFPDLLPDTYVIHSEGGWHPWKDVQEASSIYRVRIWNSAKHTVGTITISIKNR